MTDTATTSGMGHGTLTVTSPVLANELAVVLVDDRRNLDEGLELAPSTREAARRVVKHGLTLFVVLCIGLVMFLLVGTSLMHSRYQRALRNEFRLNDQNLALPPLTTTDSTGAITVKPIPAGTAVALLRIPRLNVDEAVLEGTRSSQTVHGPGHLAASPLPGQLGNAVFVGRHNTGGAPFHDLGSLHPGDHFMFVVSGGTVDYRVTSVRTRPASDTSVFATQHAGGKTLNTATLVTSTSMFDTSHRLVVVGQLNGPTAGFTPGHIAPTAADLGLAADRSALVPLAFALQLLLLASIGAVWLTKRWHRYAAWTMAAPVVLCCTWLVFEQFTRILPSSL